MCKQHALQIAWNNCPKHSILRFSSFALKIYLWLKMCQHNLPCSIVLPTACFPEGPSPHFTLYSFWRRRPRLEAVYPPKTEKIVRKSQLLCILDFGVLVRRQNHAGTTVSWTTVQREKNSHAYKLSSNVQTACSTDSLNNCPKHSILRFSSFALKIYLWLKMCQHNLPCSIVLPTACFPEGPSPHFTLCSFWRRRPRLEAVG